MGHHIAPIKLESSYTKSATSFAGATLIFAGFSQLTICKKNCEATCPPSKVMNINVNSIVTSELLVAAPAPAVNSSMLAVSRSTTHEEILP